MRAEITKEVTAQIAHRLWNHPGACKNIHGHSYRIKVTVGGEIDSNKGMVHDFGSLKNVIESITKRWDHAIILHYRDPFIPVISKLDTNLINFSAMPTAENMAIVIAEHIERAGYDVIRVYVYETDTSCATWEK